MLVSQVVERAARLLFAGQAMTGPERTAGLEMFQAMMRDLPGRIGGSWRNVVASEAYTAGEDERITCYGSFTVTIPDYIYTADASGVPSGTTYSSTTMRPPKDGARVQVTDAGDSTERLWFWRADKAYWCEVGALTLSSEVPLSSEFDHYLPAMLAVFWHDEYPGSNLGEATVFRANKGYSKIRAKTRRSDITAVDTALLNLSIQTGMIGREL